MFNVCSLEHVATIDTSGGTFGRTSSFLPLCDECGSEREALSWVVTQFSSPIVLPLLTLPGCSAELALLPPS